MVSKKNGLFITVIGILSFLFSATYISSCTRPLEEFPYSCAGITCYNGGKCDSAKCICPVGYEGANCSKVTIEKFYGNWNVTSTNIGSDSIKNKGKKTVYNVRLRNTATLTTFFIENFANNSSYNTVLCKMDENNTNNFSIDTLSTLTMFYHNYRILRGFGRIHDNDSITAEVCVRSLNSTVNWQRDTFLLKMKRM
ncbi:MAG: calcium-binding EGF-like domain-containing protein [Taibaiella sp.]|nr:calcium-binding EGF-like domain-containing protein [Taibaiella sp.]